MCQWMDDTYSDHLKQLGMLEGTYIFSSFSLCSFVLMGVSCLGLVVRTGTEGSSQFPLTDFMSCACFVGVKKEGHWLVVGSRG
jgi:hypothetical protein